MADKQVETSSDDIRMPLTSADVLGDRMEGLRELIPEAFVEGKVDFDQLKAALGEFVDEGRERYGLSWAGKADAIRNIQTPSVGTLVPVPEESINFDTTENLFIEGDNLEVLKLLQKSYYGKVKMIYIDPPYNTGNEFIYPDNFREGLEDYLKYSGQVGDGDIRLSTNTETSGRYHSKWLDMMYPRLFLGRNLLRQDGVIFVSIDDNEVHNLRLLMDEVFGVENFVACFTWTTKKGAQGMQTKHMVVSNHEYILAYARDANEFSFIGEERTEEGFSNPDDDPRGPWKRQYLQRLGQGLPTRTLVNPENGMEFSFETPYTEEKINNWVTDNRIIFPDNPNQYPARKEFLVEYAKPKQLVTTLGLHPTKSSTEKLYALFDGKKVFSNPKPSSVISYLVTVTTEPTDMVLDFFAGSATTFQAILEANAKDSGSRLFVGVQLPEPCDEESEAARAGYKKITDIGKERIHRCIAEFESQQSGQLPSFSSDEIAEWLGVRVFRLTSSNFKIWDGENTPNDADALEGQLRLFADHVMPDRGEQDILYELMLKAGLPLTAKIEEKDVAGQTAYSIADGLLLICLANPITQETLRAMIALNPQRIVCLDPAFKGNDQLKTNTVLEMKSHNIEFRTV